MFILTSNEENLLGQIGQIDLSKIIYIRQEYLKPYHCMQTNDYNEIEIVAPNYIIAREKRLISPF